MKSTRDKGGIETLIHAVMRRCDGEGVHPTALRELRLSRHDRKTEATPTVYSPMVCFVLQGEKVAWTADKVYHYNPATYLISCIDIPATFQVVGASPEHPYIGMVLDIQPSLIYELLKEISPAENKRQEPVEGFFADKVTPALADAFARLLATLDDANERKILSPSIIKEIHYHLLISRHGGRIRQLGVVGSKLQSIGKVVEQMRKDFVSSLKVTDLAQMANMSPSTFHLHFREVTRMSPLQYQKQIRLQEARRLLTVENIDAATAAFQVGYESPSQFSREYRRVFGQPPMRDVEQLRKTVPLPESAAG